MTTMTHEQAYEIINKYVNEMDDTINKHIDDNRIEQINAVIKEHSLVHGWIRLWLDWDYQVNNGGVSQYVCNNYHTTSANGCFSKTSDNDDVHQELVLLTEKFLEENDIPLGNDLLSILKDFKITLDDEYYIEECCNTCGGNGLEEHYNEDADEYEDVECSTCDGSGEEEVYNERYEEPDYNTEALFKQLDKRYYKINDELMFQIANTLEH